MRAWITQDAKHVKKVGAENASFYVNWIDPEGKRCCKSCGKGRIGKSAAAKLKQRVEAELITGTYEDRTKRSWQDFQADYEEKIVAKKAVRSQSEIIAGLNNFVRIIHPRYVSTVRTATIDNFIAKRREENGKKKGQKLSPATVNKDLRHVKAALRKAVQWRYLKEVPHFDFEREPVKLATYIPPNEFAVIYRACESARMPSDLRNVTAADWRRALLTMAYMTGWRVSEILAFRNDDFDAEAETAITRHGDNKGKREERTKLHPVIVAHLQTIRSFGTHVFEWNQHRRTLDIEFHKIQKSAGIHVECREDHEHTPACHYYGFHDLRRAFATLNADRLTADALQSLMRHKSYLTTKRYISMTRQLDSAVESLHVPDVLAGVG